MRIVGERKYSMRIWLDPSKLAQYSMTPQDVIASLKAQNKQVGAGDIGAAPAPEGQMYQYNIKLRGRLTDSGVLRKDDRQARLQRTACAFERCRACGAGGENYTTGATYKGHDAVAIVVYLRVGGNAIKVSDGVHKVLVDQGATFYPAGLKVDVCLDTTEQSKPNRRHLWDVEGHRSSLSFLVSVPGLEQANSRVHTRDKDVSEEIAEDRENCDQQRRPHHEGDVRVQHRVDRK